MKIYLTFIFTFRGPCIVIYSYDETNEIHYFSNLFWNRTLHVSDRFSVHHQESNTVYTTTGVCHTGFADCLPAGSGWNWFRPGPLVSSQQNLYDIYLLLCIQYWTPDDGQKTCPKHVEFYSKNKFEKLVHIFGFIIRMCQNIRQFKSINICFWFCALKVLDFNLYAPDTIKFYQLVTWFYRKSIFFNLSVNR
jgi:hypothetical protein